MAKRTRLTRSDERIFCQECNLHKPANEWRAQPRGVKKYVGHRLEATVSPEVLHSGSQKWVEKSVSFSTELSAADCWPKAKRQNATSFDTFNRRPVYWCVYPSAEGMLKLGALPLTILQVGWWNQGDVNGREDNNTGRVARPRKNTQIRVLGILSEVLSWLHTQLQAPFSVNSSFTEVFTAEAKGGRSAGRRQ